ncbi:MAG: translocation/assembly module TamB domain-containing protein [Betaproteobacteria bacterium]|nr:translocation/assembly module TamB domain-containing protein [Betaproteobacteria bacterium]
MADVASTPPAPPPAPLLAPATPVRTGLSLLVPLLSVVSLILLIVLGTAGGMRWLLVTDAGTAWLLRQLPALEMRGFTGALVGPSWRAESLRLPWAGGTQWLLVEGLQAEGVQWQWRPHGHAWLGLRATAVSARRITVHTGPPGPPVPRPLALPAALKPPLHLALDALQVDELVVDEMAPLRTLRVAGLELDPRPGASHHIDKFELQVQSLLIAGDLKLANAQPYAVTAQATLRPALEGDTPAWAAVVGVKGTAAELDIEATLRGRPQGKLAAPKLDLHAGLRPLQAWMLSSLQLQTEALDLAALSPRAPSTRLTGQATLKGGDKGSPLVVQVRLDNAQPGRWDEGRLPVRQLLLDLGGRLAQPDHVDLTRFEAALADANGSAGRVSGTGIWQGHTLTLDTRVESLTPQRLDGRAAAMTLTGPVALTLRGLRSPDFTAAPPAPLPPELLWKVDLQGKLDGTTQAVQLQLDGRADDNRLELTRASAKSGGASAELSASVTRASRGEWGITTAGTVTDFDPLPWWPGEAGGAWRKGPHRLSGEWKFDLRVPGNADRLPLLELAQRVAGNGRLRVQRSMLAGVPLTADLTLGYMPSAAPMPATLVAEVQLGRNHLRVDGRGDPAGSGGTDRWRIKLGADALAELAPLAQLHPALAGWTPRGGSVVATLSADGRWPAMRTEGSAEVAQLQLGPLRLARGTAAWGLETGGAQPLALKLDLADLNYAGQRADNLRAELRGTLAEHEIDISGAMPVVPPMAVERLLGVQVQSGTRAQMQAQGQWIPNPAGSAGGGRWKAQIQRLIVGSWDGSGDTAPPASGWIEARDLRAEFEFDAGMKLVALQAAPGRVQLANTVALRWEEVNVDMRGTQPLVRLRADIESFALAPLLARLQPEMGWQGDLRLAARVDIRAAEKMDADVVFERVDGDLHVVGADSTQLLGLSEARLAISARDGVWRFTPAFRGRSLGELEGEVQVRSTPERRWPQPEDVVSGRLQARVADIGIWSAWVPPGWRLVGTLNTTAVLSGSFRSPNIDGELGGSGLGARNLLQGVNVRDGEVLVKLEGDTARIERFTLRGGEGSASITGSAQLVGKPSAKLQLKADRLRVLGRVDRMVTASGNAELQLSAERTQLDGKFVIDEAFYDASRADAPSLDDDVTLRRGDEDFSARTDTGETTPKRSFVMAVDVDLGQKVHIRGRGLDTGLRGQVRLSAPGGRLAVTGTIRTDGGTYAAYGQALEIERGIVAFSGAADNPRLDVLALRPKIDQRVGVAITGNLLTPRVRLFSEPEMGDSEKLSWLVLGRAPEGLGRNDTALLQRAAVGLLAGEGEAPTDALLKNLGIDEISLRQGEGDVRETIITVGKQLSRRWYVGYERGVNATTGSWQLIYRIAQRFTLRAQSGEDSAIDVIWTWRTQETPADAGMRKSTVVPR